MEVPVQDLKETRYILSKTSYSGEKIKLEKIIPWQKLYMIPSIANGPKLEELHITMPWASVLKLLLEITMVGMEKDPEM